MTEKGPRAPQYPGGLPSPLDERRHSAEKPAAGLVEAARRVFLEAAEAGRVEAALPAAVMLLRGEGGEADPEHGLRWLRVAAEHGAAGAALLLGRLRLATVGVAAEGVRWLRVAADAGEAEALHLLGLAYQRGAGVKRNLAKARRLQQKAAADGVVDAQFELSLLLAQGIGGRRDRRGAASWEAKAAKAGHPRACLNRGARLANKKRPDFAKVTRWYARAAAGGNAEAAERLCKMTKKPETSSFLPPLQAEIAKATPKALGDTEGFMKGGSAEGIKSSPKGNGAQQKEQATGDLKKSSKEVPSESRVPAKPVTPLAVEPAAAPQVNAAEAIPASKPDAEVSLQASKVDVQRDRDKEKLIDKRLRKANDPRFSAVLSVKDPVGKHADAGPAKYRAKEAGTLAHTAAAKKGAVTLLGVKGGSTRSGHLLDDLRGRQELDSNG